MGIDRRTLLTGLAAATGTLCKAGSAQAKSTGTTKLRRIATEEAWSIPEHVASLIGLGKTAWDNLDARSWRKVTM